MIDQGGQGNRSEGVHGPMLSVAKDEAGERIDIATLAELKRQGRERPACFCLSCDRELVARIGPKKRHHFGHKASREAVGCWATSPEGELHISAKRRIEKELLKACASSEGVSARLPCPVCGRPEVLTHVAALSPAHRVLVEYWGDPSRVIKPDVQVLDAAGKPVLFIEVRVTHASGEDKIRFVKERRVPFLELDGKYAIGLPEGSGAVFDCLMQVNMPPPMKCGRCLRREEQQRAAVELAVRRSSARRVAEKVVRERWLPITKLVAWCHVFMFDADKLVKTERLVVSITWKADGLDELALKSSSPAILIGIWKGATSYLDGVYAKELIRAARGFVEGLRASLGSKVAIETFGGFRTEGYREFPPKFERVRDPKTGVWLTAYPGQEAIRWAGLEGPECFGSDGGREGSSGVGDCRLVDARQTNERYRANRLPPSLAPPKLEESASYNTDIECETNKIMREGGPRSGGDDRP